MKYRPCSSPPHLFERKNSVKDRAVTDTRKSEDRRHTSMPVFTKEKPSQMKIKNALSLRGTLTVPGDKSISHRSVMLGAIAEGDTVVHGFLYSADCLATIDCFRRMGVKIEELRGEAGENVLIVHGRGRRGLKAPDESLDAMNSGTTVRLLSGILAGQSFSSPGRTVLQLLHKGRRLSLKAPDETHHRAPPGNGCPHRFGK